MKVSIETANVILQEVTARPSADPENIALVLKHAYGLIEEGWCQGTVHEVINGKDYYCLIGAISQAAATLSDDGFFRGIDNPSYLDARWALTRVLPVGFESIPEFNDSRYTRKEDVLRAIESAIEEAIKQ